MEDILVRLENLYQNQNVKMSNERLNEVQQLLTSIKSDIGDENKVETDAKTESVPSQPTLSDVKTTNTSTGVYDVIFKKLSDLGYEINDENVAIICEMLDDFENHPIVGRLLKFFVDKIDLIKIPSKVIESSDYLEEIRSKTMMFLEDHYEKKQKIFNDTMKSTAADLISFFISKFGENIRVFEKVIFGKNLFRHKHSSTPRRTRSYVIRRPIYGRSSFFSDPFGFSLSPAYDPFSLMSYSNMFEPIQSTFGFPFGNPYSFFNYRQPVYQEPVVTYRYEFDVEPKRNSRQEIDSEQKDEVKVNKQETSGSESEHQTSNSESKVTFMTIGQLFDEMMNIMLGESVMNVKKQEQNDDKKEEPKANVPEQSQTEQNSKVENEMKEQSEA
eukprot:TRINITY_DN3281_c2_g2_i1.p1 TRINITY_DN3281_c2_g2~~TRINITY_DN3281_c2_g2_i1.p1  ORF type:complete len:386 (+),score=128.56 TRINITY_DN3281_c2_g2_i1:333-1490(+)